MIGSTEGLILSEVSANGLPCCKPSRTNVSRLRKSTLALVKAALNALPLALVSVVPITLTRGQIHLSNPLMLGLGIRMPLLNIQVGHLALMEHHIEHR